ncbi:MAG TPA: hypothetical protein VN285_09735 [Candidatus Deferrimicrobium sp.]|nr:hypothetical protein [Candidatus Deferrimicrobium sp.]
MAKKQSFADKVKKAQAKEGREISEYVQWVKAYKAPNGAWKFRTMTVGVTEKNKNEIYG